MIHHKTYNIHPDGNINCSNRMPAEKNRAIVGQAYYVRLCYHTCHNTCSQMDLLSRAFTDAQLCHDDTPNQKQFHISIIVPPCAKDKYKPEDHETSLDRIEWLITNFQPPTIELVISIYVTLGPMSDVESGFFTSTLWPLRRRWNIENTTKKVTCQKIEGGGASSWKLHQTEALVDLTHHMADRYGYRFQMFDYTWNYEDVLTNLLESRMHFGYIGASYFIAAAVGVPTLGFGQDYREEEIDGKPVARNLFGTSQTSFAHMRQRNPETLQVEHRPLTSSYGTRSPLHVLDEFYRLEDIVLTKRDT